MASLIYFLCRGLQPSPSTYSEVFQCMFDYIDRIFAIVRPRKVLFMAIGVQVLRDFLILKL